MIVVTDTSVVLNLCCLRLEGLLLDLFGEVLAPETVAEEFSRLAAVDPRFKGLVFPRFIRICRPSGIVPALLGNHRLHAGEIEAISLALEKQATALLIDERAGRMVAASMHLNCVGILGVLLQAKGGGLISEIGPWLKSLEFQSGFWITESLKRRVLSMAGEHP